jgi:hypothetical protein
MIKNNQKPAVETSSSSHLPSSLDLSVLTSTKYQETCKLDSHTSSRRKSLIPTPHRPTVVKQVNPMETVVHQSLFDLQSDSSESEDTADEKRRVRKKHNSNRLTSQICIVPSDLSKISENDSNLIEGLETLHIGGGVPENAEEDFDSFILHNFIAFSGAQDVNDWLDETEDKFMQLKISRALRFDAISLLVKGNAKRWYIKHRREIQSFEDFYELLSIEFDTANNNSLQPVPNNLTLNEASKRHITSSNQNKESEKMNHINNSQNADVSHQAAAFSSTTFIDLGATGISGGRPAVRSSGSVHNSSSMILDDTLHDLRKAVIETLIKNPRTFRGGKDDVKKWLEEIEHLLDIAHMNDSNRLDVISYSLRGDALQWYKNHKSTLNSWQIFVAEITRAFTSSFHEEIAFKKLESYTQGENQSIRNFFNEVLKLCKEADSTMSEATKLKNLLNKTKPSIQLEVRKKKPLTTADFLEHAKDAEELFQLSASVLDSTQRSNSSNKNHQHVSTLMSTSMPPNNLTLTSNPVKANSGYSKSASNYNSTSQNKNQSYSARPQNNNWEKFRANRNQSGYAGNNDSRSQNRNEPTHNPPSSNHTVNSILASGQPPQEMLPQEVEPSIQETQCQLCGHGGSVDPSF